MTLPPVSYVRRSILLVDADPGVLETLKSAASGFAASVHTASSGSEALEKIEALRPGVVVLDLALTDVDGFEIFRRIRENPTTRDLVVFVTHPAPSEAEVFRAFSLHSDCFLTKPIDTAGLAEFLRRLHWEPLEPESSGSD
ncbi:MAG: two-component system response regulator [Armatimonadota bacterium]